MARKLNAQSQAIIDACRDHMMIDGSGDWQAVRLRFPGVPRSTFFRLAEIARQQIEGAAVASDSPEALKRAQQKIRRTIETPSALTAKVKMHLPAAPSPSVVAEMDPAERRQVFDFIAYFHGVVRDADLMRSKSVRVKDGVEELANPMLMDLSIRRRLQVMETYMQSMEQLYNMEKIQELYRAVIDEVGKADPGVQQLILARLRALNNRVGLTVAAQL